MFKLFKKNAKTALLFECLYFGILSFIYVPIMSALMNLSIKAANIKYLSMSTLKMYLSSPLTWIIIIALLIIIVFAVLYEISAMIIIYDASYHNKKITMCELVGSAFFASIKVVLPKNLLIIPFLLLVLPVGLIIDISSITSYFSIPGFITDFIFANTFLSVLVAVVAIVLMYLVLKFLFSLEYFTLDQNGFISACKKSKELTKKKKIKTAIYILIGAIILFLLHIVITIIVSLFVAFIVSLFVNDNPETIAKAEYIARVFAFTLVNIPIIPLGFAIISNKFYGISEEKNIDVPTITNKKYNKAKLWLVIIIIIVCVAGLVVNVFVDTGTGLSPYIYEKEETTIVAHRGYSDVAPENNMPAFEKAIECGVTMIELDVHQTKDGVIVVTHDANINRIAGVDKNVYDLTFEELETYDVGSWFSEKYKGLKVATLDQVIKLCKDNDVEIQIELKPTGNEENFEENVIKVVRDNDYENMVFLASLNGDCVKKCNELAPDIRTLYIMAIASGDVANIDFADAFSLEETNVTFELVEEAHRLCKPVYVWTINDADSVDELIEKNVDGLVTDKIEEIRDKVQEIEIENKSLYSKMFDSTK